MARPEKEATVAEVKERFQKAKTVVLADYRGLNVSEVSDLRRKMRAAGLEYKVIKNTLATIAAREAELAGLETYLAGPTAMAFSYDDPVAPAKILSDFAKDHKKLELKAGVLEGRILDQAQIKALANVPPREQLLAMAAGMFQAPMRGLVTVLSGPLRNLAYGLEALRKQKAAAEA